MQRLTVPSFSRSALPGIALLGVLLVFGCADRPTSPTSPDGDLSAAFGEPGPPQDLGPALAAQRAHSERLMALEDVVGTAVGLAEGEAPSVVVYLVRPGARGVPDALDGVPVERVVTGRIDAIADPTTRLRPAPVGFSVGHPNITAGTYGARVKDGSGGTLMLSNNHVLAASNEASIGDPILQPGPHDGGTDPDDRIATLHDYQAIDFSGGSNLMDAAVAAPLDPADLSASTPTDDGYGTPGSAPYALDANEDGSVDAGVVGLAVQKYGRTTSLTQGEVAEINVQISVCYEVTFFFCSKAATFADQLGISDGSFSGGGDSGSLIVTNDASASPVGLLFAGGDTRTFANRIDLVLDRFGVSVDAGSGSDGGGDGGDTNASPTAAFTASCAEDLSCDFDGSGSSDDGTIVSWDWDFGDGSTAAGVTPSHTYAETGSYAVTLTVTDDQGATGSTTKSVKVGNEAPTADFISLCSGLSCAWDGNYSSDPDGTIVSYHWDLGDGTEKTVAMPSHTYAADGTYTVVLTVTDDQGATDSKSEDVTVSGGETSNEAPVSDFSVSCADLACDFTDASSDPDGSIASWSWEFGDGSGSTEQHPSHTYGAGGTYTVSLTVTDDAGATDTSSQDVSVSEPAGSEITLTASGRKATRGMRHVDLSWSGATSTDVDIYRDGDFLVETPNDGEHQDSFKGGGSATYRVCEAGTSTCSESVTVRF
jgi:PKD repeat protein